MRLLSIVVPIKNNYSCLRAILKQIERMNPDDVELVISDNTKMNQEILDILGDNPAENIVYIHNKSEISMTENFERGIEASGGKYVCMIGADDAVSSRIIDVARYLDENNIDSAACRKALYNWPEVKFRAHSKSPSLTIRKSTGKSKVIDINMELVSLLKKGMISVGKLPEPYHGLVRKELFSRILAKTGRYIPGASPDMAMAVALSQVTNTHIFIEAPITISGHCYNSAGGKGARGEHKGELKDKPFLPADIEMNWPEFIPKVWTPPTLYADSMASALSAMQREDLLQSFNREANYANLAVFFPEYYPKIKPYIKNPISRLKVIYHIIKFVFFRSIKYIENYLGSNFSITQNHLYRQIQNSFEASQIVDNFLDQYHSEKPYLRPSDHLEMKAK